VTFAPIIDRTVESGPLNVLKGSQIYKLEALWAQNTHTVYNIAIL